MTRKRRCKVIGRVLLFSNAVSKVIARVLLFGNAVLPLTGLEEDSICIHPEFSSDYREDCFSFAVRKSFCRTKLWRRFLFKLKCISSSADLRFGAISWWISPSALRRTRYEINIKAAAKRLADHL